jgi:hypothetical protein
MMDTWNPDSFRNTAMVFVDDFKALKAENERLWAVVGAADRLSSCRAADGHAVREALERELIATLDALDVLKEAK